MMLITEATFVRQVLHTDCPVLVCFGMQRCPACRILMPTLARIAVTYHERLRVATVRIDHAPLLAEQYDVIGHPLNAAKKYGNQAHG